MNKDDEQELEDEYAEKLTPQIRPRVTGYRMPDDERDSRRAPTSDGRTATKRTMAPPLGVPLPEAHESGDTTDPFDLFQPGRANHRRHGDSAVALAQKLRDEKPDPYDLIAAMAFEFIHKKDEDRSASKELDRQFQAFMSRQPGGKEFERLKGTVGIIKWIGAVVLTAALGSLGLAISTLWSRAEHDGSLNTKVERLQQDVQQLLREGRRNIAKDTP